MRPAKDWDEAYLNELIRVSEMEGSTLDYKRSAAITKNDREKNELSKDVSAFANSAGGILVYGMVEDGHVPTAIDGGIDRNVLTKEWLESVIKSWIQPAVDGLFIKQIDLPSKGADRVAYVVEVPPATHRAPHQATDHRYYKRFNFVSTPMEDYEVRDVMRRGLEYAAALGFAWEALIEARRLGSASREKAKVFARAQRLPRADLLISVSAQLRASGKALILLNKPTRLQIAELLIAVDAYTSIVENRSPGNDRVDVDHEMKRWLDKVVELTLQVSAALSELVGNEP
jgi:hypothetical protein